MTPLQNRFSTLSMPAPFILLAAAGQRFYRRMAMNRAGALTYSTLLTLIPGLILLFTVFRSQGGLEPLQKLIEPYILSALNPSASEPVTNFITDLVNGATSKSLGIVGLLFLFSMVFALLNSIEKDFNGIWETRKNRALLHRVMVYWTMITLAPLLLGLSVYLSTKAVALSFWSEIPLAHRLGVSWIPFFLELITFWWVYWAIPNTRVSWGAALGGAVVTAVMMEIAKVLFTLYSSRAIQYNLVYGSLAVFPLFLIWLYLIWLIVLFGAEFSFIVQNRQVVLRRHRPGHEAEITDTRLALAVMHLIMRGFRKQDENLLTVEQLAERMDVDEGRINRVITLLEEASLVRRTEELDSLFYMPARDPAGISLFDVVSCTMPLQAEEIGRTRMSEDLQDMLSDWDRSFEDICTQLKSTPLIREET